MLQFMRAILISVLAGIFVAGAVWLLWDYVRRPKNAPPPDKDES